MHLKVKLFEVETLFLNYLPNQAQWTVQLLPVEVTKLQANSIQDNPPLKQTIYFFHVDLTIVKICCCYLVFT